MGIGLRLGSKRRESERKKQNNSLFSSSDYFWSGGDDNLISLAAVCIDFLHPSAWCQKPYQRAEFSALSSKQDHYGAEEERRGKHISFRTQLDWVCSDLLSLVIFLVYAHEPCHGWLVLYTKRFLGCI